MCKDQWVIKYFIIIILILCSGVQLEYLPPYSPNLNQIEEAFSSIKAWLQRNCQYADNELASQSLVCATDLLMAAMYSVMPPKAHGWFRHSGYLWALIVVWYFIMYIQLQMITTKVKGKRKKKLRMADWVGCSSEKAHLRHQASSKSLLSSTRSGFTSVQLCLTSKPMSSSLPESDTRR
jgi:hypothetical protein